jgi:hypothetical protein
MHRPLSVSQGAVFDTAELNIPELNASASIANVLPGMANHSLLSAENTMQ